MKYSKQLQQIYQTLNLLDKAIPLQAMSKNTTGVAQSPACRLPVVKRAGG